MSKHHHTYLALGDSYTIGESVPLYESFPYQVVQLLRNQGIVINAPEILAKTGWTSSELAEHLLHTKLEESYDFITLLIGVNNQYRNLHVKDFGEDFYFLLTKAIHLANGKADHVIVLSIPDWGVTPFAKKRNAGNVSAMILPFNEVCESVAGQLGAHFIDITQDSLAAETQSNLLAPDQLHYSGQTHLRWAEKTAALMGSVIHS